MNTTIEQLRERLAAAAKKAPDKSVNSAASEYFPFWKMDTGQKTTVRFLPDGNQDNPFFWAEKNHIELPFSGVVGQGATDNVKVIVKVPCMKMYDEVCPIIEDTKGLWTDNKDLARLYYFKRSYLFNALIVSSDLTESALPESAVRLLSLTKTLYDQITPVLTNPDLEYIPTDFEHGRDFTIAKSQKGQWANYETSSFSMKERALDAVEIEAAKGINNLADRLGAKPTDEQQKMIYEMYESSRKSEEFDPARFKGFYYQRKENANLAEDFS